LDIPVPGVSSRTIPLSDNTAQHRDFKYITGTRAGKGCFPKQPGHGAGCLFKMILAGMDMPAGIIPAGCKT